DYRAFRKGVTKLHEEHARRGIDLFDDPIMSEAFAVVYPREISADPHDDAFIDEPLSRWYTIDLQRSREVCRNYCGLWWIVRPSSTKSQSESELEFNVSLLNIVPEQVSNTGLPLFIFRQPTGGSRGIDSWGRVLSLDSDHVLL